MIVDLKPIAESKVRQLGGDVCGVLVRKDDRLAAVDEHGRVQWLQDGQGAEPVAFAVYWGNGEVELYEAPMPVLGDEPEGVTPLYTHPQPAQQGSVPEGWRECLTEMVQAMHDYEMSVDEDAPYKHRAMMDRAHALLSTTPHADGRIDHQCELCGHKWSSNDLMDDCVVCTKPAGQEGE